MKDTIIKMKSGLIACIALAAIATLLGHYFPLVGSAVFAITLGMIVKNMGMMKEEWQVGAQYSGKKLLQYSIIALGFTMSFKQVQDVGLSSLQVTIVTIAIAILTAYLVGNAFGLSKNLKILVGIGTAICGGSAIAAASPIIEAEDEEIALSISTIFLFNVLAVFLFPFLGHLMQMDASQFGLWAGTAINDTSSVVAAGYSYSTTAGDIATIVKLSRALMIVPACLILMGIEAYQKRKASVAIQWNKIFPMFIIWFLAASFLTSFVSLPPVILHTAKTLSKWFMAMALAGIGMQVSFKQFKEAGLKPILTGTATWFAVAVSSLIIQFFFM